MPSVTSGRVAVALAVAAVVCALIAYGSPMGIDYGAPPCAPYICDDAQPAIVALAHGKVHDFFANQPPMGSFSLVVRAPFAAVGDAFGGRDLAVYRAGVFACLVGLGLLAVWTMSAMARFSALKFGHPEELPGAALCAGGVLAAARGRTLLSGVLLGCAIATKQWALLAVPVALVAAPRGRVRMSAAAAGVAGLFTIPMILADPSRFWLAQKSVGIATTFQNTVTASNIWFPFARGTTAPTLTPHGKDVTTQYSLSHSLGHLTHPLVALLALAAIGAYAYRRREAAGDEALQLLALVFLIRCVFDPLTYSYHHAPFLVALIVYEGLRRRVPAMAGYAIAALLAMTYLVVPTHNTALINAFYLGWSLPLLAALALATLAPERMERIAARLRLRRSASALA
ncbi:MAG: DUF2029 domain-containing protein [Actinobacteria bacterium]|nr:MAG: DUF2029 domain-containing protein [Actinomycetota bacterium]